MCSLTTSTGDWYSPHFTDNITELGNLLGATLLIRGRVRIHTRQLNIGTCAACPGLYRMLLSEERLGFTDIRARLRSKSLSGRTILPHMRLVYVFEKDNSYSIKVPGGKHDCFLGKPVRKSALTLTGGNNLGSGSRLCSHS